MSAANRAKTRAILPSFNALSHSHAPCTFLTEEQVASYRTHRHVTPFAKSRITPHMLSNEPVTCHRMAYNTLRQASRHGAYAKEWSPYEQSGSITTLNLCVNVY